LSQAYEELKERISNSAAEEAAQDDPEYDVYNDIREAMIFQEEFPEMNEVQRWAMERIDKLETEEMTELALNMSLCPIHFCDYAICFDDENPECVQVRAIHPAHDT
jgi:hypothetical protein